MGLGLAVSGEGGASVVLRETRAEDLDFVTALEARPAYEAFIFRWRRAQHLEALGDPDYGHLMICGTDGAPLGFMLLAGLGGDDGLVELKRIALDRPGGGYGSAALSALAGYVFGTLRAKRLWLDVFADNLRAHRAYLRAGFVELPGPRPTALRNGRQEPLIVMAIDRPAGDPDS